MAFQQVASDWSMVIINEENLEWDVRQWKSEIGRAVRHRIERMKNKMGQKITLEWYREKGLDV